MLIMTQMKKVEGEENQKIIRIMNHKMSNLGPGMILGKRKFIEYNIL